MDEIKRPSWEEYFMEIAYVVSKRSTCLRRKVGAIAVKDRQILATGYNGAPAHVAHCSQVGCVKSELKVPSGERHKALQGNTRRTERDNSGCRKRDINKGSCGVLYSSSLYCLC